MGRLSARHTTPMSGSSTRFVLGCAAATVAAGAAFVYFALQEDDEDEDEQDQLTEQSLRTLHAAMGGQGFCEGDEDEAGFQHQLQCAHNGDPFAPYLLTKMYDHFLTDEEYLHWLQVAAERGNQDGQYSLGNHYIELDRGTEGFKWLKTCADAGHFEGGFHVASYYYQGFIVPKDEQEGARRMKPVADRDFDSYDDDEQQELHASAKWTMGLWHREGKLYPNDRQEAFRYMKAAADLGNPEAQYEVGLFYCCGYGTAQDQQAATINWERASKAGNQSACQKLSVNRKELVEELKAQHSLASQIAEPLD